MVLSGNVDSIFRRPIRVYSDSYLFFPLLCRDNLFQAYHATVDRNHTRLTAAEYEYSWYVPVEVKYKQPEGRGVYAKKFIPKGTMVWESTTRNTATFHSSHEYRIFAEYLMNDPATRNLACDVTMWIDVMQQWQTYSRYEFVICQSMDEGSLLNTVYDDAGDLINIVPEKASDEEAMVDYRANDCYGNDQYVASRDIQAGEQFRIDYGGSVGWEALGMNQTG
jgi:hypothetical protein